MQADFQHDVISLNSQLVVFCLYNYRTGSVQRANRIDRKVHLGFLVIYNIYCNIVRNSSHAVTSLTSLNHRLTSSYGNITSMRDFSDPVCVLESHFEGKINSMT